MQMFFDISRALSIDQLRVHVPLQRLVMGAEVQGCPVGLGATVPFSFRERSVQVRAGKAGRAPRELAFTAD
jgi:hypothetical protein